MQNPEIYLLGDEQTTCPYCGRRTDFYEFVHKTEQYQIHFCKAWDCGFIFLATEDE
jgi:hypothetical protein